MHLRYHISEAGKLFFLLGNLLWDGQQAQWVSMLCTLRHSDVDKVLKQISAAGDDFESVSYA